MQLDSKSPKDLYKQSCWPLRLNQCYHVKSVHIRSYSGLYSVEMRVNTDQNNSESDTFHAVYSMCLVFIQNAYRNMIKTSKIHLWITRAVKVMSEIFLLFFISLSEFFSFLRNWNFKSILMTLKFHAPSEA